MPDQKKVDQMRAALDLARSRVETATGRQLPGSPPPEASARTALEALGAAVQRLGEVVDDLVVDAGAARKPGWRG